jgi:hypothetical protein
MLTRSDKSPQMCRVSRPLHEGPIVLPLSNQVVDGSRPFTYSSPPWGW